MNSTIAISDEVSSPKQAAPSFSFVVGFYFSFRLIIGLFATRVLGTDPQAGTELSLGLNFLLFFVVAFNSLGDVLYPIDSMFRLWSIRWVFLFLAFSCCSLAWSSTASLSASFAYWGALVADVAIVMLLLRAEPAATVAPNLMKGFIWSTCIIAVVAWLMPAQSDLRLGDEELLNSNQIGNLCAFAFFMCQYLMRIRKEKWSPVATFLGITLLRSLSKTTIIAFLVSQCFLLLRDKTISRRTKINLAILFACLIVAFWSLIEAYYVVYTDAGNQAETLTGRVGIWSYVLNESLEQPWIGHGFNSIWKIIPPFGEFEARHAENELLQQFYAYGIVGLGLLVGVYASLYRQVRKLSRGPMRIFFVSMLLFFVVRGSAEAEPFDLLFPLWVIVLISLLTEQAVASAANAESKLPARTSIPATVLWPSTAG
jgi:exopolysaccharide production protein ExoQ